MIQPTDLTKNISKITYKSSPSATPVELPIGNYPIEIYSDEEMDNVKLDANNEDKVFRFNGSSNKGYVSGYLYIPNFLNGTFLLWTRYQKLLI